MYKDSEKTRRYVDNVDMLIVVIKITEIKEAARCIEPYIHNLSIPIIPVLTFFDVWAENPAFVTCSNDEEAICKAKELIKDLIPSLSKHEIRTIAVSSKTKHNIRALRESVCNFVEPQNFALQKIKSETPEVFRRRVNEISREINKVTVDTENSLSRLEREMQGLIPKSHEHFESFEQFFKKQKDKLNSSSKHEISQCVKDISADFKNIGQEIISLNTLNKIKEHISKVEEDMNSTKLVELNSKIDDLLLNLKAILFDSVSKYIDRLDIDDSTKKEWKESVFEGIDNYRPDIDNLIEYKAPSVALFEVEKMTKDIADLVTDNLTNPQILAIPIVVTIYVSLPNIPWIGNALQSILPLSQLIIILLATVGLSIFFSDKTKRLEETKRKITSALLSSFDKQKFVNDSQKRFVQTADELLDLVHKELQYHTSPYSRDVVKISDGVKEFQLAVKTTNKFLQNQIELLESEQLS
jgi:hypothetical protein